jgi:glycosyltransferase involved in cell wall biosynthesis
MIGTGMDTRGGVAAVVRVYAEQGLLQRHAVTYIATHGDGNRWFKLQRAFTAWCRYLALLFTGQVALLHVHASSGPSFWRKCLFMVPSFALRVPVVMHMHGGGFLLFYERSHWPGRRAFIAWVFDRCRAVVALSDQWNDTLSGLFPRAHVRTIVNPITLPAREASLVQNPPTVLFLGVLVRAKGVYELLEAWEGVVARMPQARLLLGGTGDDAAVRRIVEDRGMQSSVQLLGWIDAEARQRWLDASWTLVLPSHAEAMPMSVLEAMAAGVPVVASRVGGIPLAVRDGVDGMLVEPRDVPALRDALLRLLGDRDARLAMGASAREHVRERFAASVILPQIESLWAELLRTPLEASP